MDHTNITAKKIVLIGLDNGGKTSILLSLQRDINLLSYYSMQPTQGLNIERFKDRGIEFSIWNFGGQEEYRRQYLQKMDENFKEVDKVIFVIDIQDIERYEIALDYLKQIIQYLINHKNKADFSIFLHKFDPNLQNKPEFSEESLSVNLYEKMKTILPPDFKYDLFKTSIYTVFQKRSFTLNI